MNFFRLNIPYRPKANRLIFLMQNSFSHTPWIRVFHIIFTISWAVPFISILVFVWCLFIHRSPPQSPVLLRLIFLCGFRATTTGYGCFLTASANDQFLCFSNSNIHMHASPMRISTHRSGPSIPCPNCVPSNIQDTPPRSQNISAGP